MGSKGAGDGQLMECEGIAVHPSTSHVYVADHNNHRISVFDSKGAFVRSFGSEGSEAEQFNHPTGIAFSTGTGLLYICDTHNHRVCIYDSDGKWLRAVGGKRGDADGELSEPSHVAVCQSPLDTTQDRVYVTDYGNDRVQVYDQDGKFLLKFGKTGKAHCFGHGMQLLLRDGGSVAVERVVVGDQLIGGDGHPAVVTAVVAGVTMGAEQLWTLRMKDFNLKPGSYSTHSDVVVTNNHLLELVTWRRLRVKPNNKYYWHHFRPYLPPGQQHPPGGGWVPVPMGDTSVWTGEYGYRVVHQPLLSVAAFKSYCASLRLNFRGVRWSVTVAAYVAQLTAVGRGLPWPHYDGSPRCEAACRGSNGCRKPTQHNIPHSQTWWALYQPAPDHPVQFIQAGRSLHDRILQLFGAGTADPWAAPDNQQQARWLLEDTYQMAWLIGFWLADGSKREACIAQVEYDIFGGDNHDEAVEGIRQLASLVGRLRLNPGVPRAALMTHAQFWNVNPQPAFLPPGHVWLANHPAHLPALHQLTGPGQLLGHFSHIGVKVDLQGAAIWSITVSQHTIHSVAFLALRHLPVRPLITTHVTVALGCRVPGLHVQQPGQVVVPRAAPRLRRHFTQRSTT